MARFHPKLESMAKNPPTVDAVIEILQRNSLELLAENFVECMGYTCTGGRFKFTVQHVVDWRPDDSCLIRSTVGYGIRVNHSMSQETDLSALRKQPSRLPQLRSVPAVSAAA